jgi:hypothetical protein
VELASSLSMTMQIVSCLYVNKLEDIDLTVLEDMVKRSVRYMTKNDPLKQ